MATLFGTHLVRQGVITPEDLLEALDEQRRARPPFGRVAVVARLLSVKQVTQILDTQASDPRPFGDLAIDLGMLDVEGVARVLYLQHRSTPRLGEILVRRGCLTPARLEAELAGFRRSYRPDREDYDAEAG